jgi:hypothetical protein
MKRITIAAALVLGTLSPALASSHYEMTWHDNIRPHGHPRSTTVVNAAVNYCYGQTGLSRDAAATPALKDCMKTRNYTWVSTKLVQNPPSRQDRASTQDKDGFIDPDTGLLCHNTGFASICEPPPADRTIHYTDKHGLNCTRTGGLAICSNL